jgi:3-hydroxybutyryl-CoA dehydrogenase
MLSGAKPIFLNDKEVFMEINNIAIIGAGTMGHGIALVASMAGFQVFLRDIEQEYLDAGLKKIQSSLSRVQKKGKISEEDAKGALDRIQTTTALKEAIENADYIIEAVPEILDLKKELFAEMDELAPSHAIMATNTSQFRITAIGSTTMRREKIIGAHFFNPPVVRRLVEIVRALDTSDETLARTKSLCEKFGMQTVVCNRDTAGFITTRLTALWTVEAERIYEEGIASIEDIDKACRLAFGHPMGPFETSDLVGLDSGLRVRMALSDVYGERFRPTQTRINLVESGNYGRKTGRGFYKYE